MNQHAIYHIPDIPYAFAEDKNTLKVRLRCATDDIRSAAVVFKDRYDWVTGGERVPMEILSKTGLFTVYEAALRLMRNRYRYYFEITDTSGNRVYYDERGYRTDDEAGYEYRAFQFPFIAPADVYQGKTILEKAVVYQIFPERFCNGDPSNDPEGTLEWGGVPERLNAFGGDIRGITGKIPYLKELGVNLLYLTPIFLSKSNHKYNIRDYYQVDPQFGTLEDAREMVAACHHAGIKVLFDAVFNHTGDDFFAFADVLEKQAESPYQDWYYLDEFPVDPEECNYYTFANGIPAMPKLRTENPQVRDYFFKVGQYWIREIGIDGWRLDVCDEVDHKFWQGFKQAIEAVDPAAVLVGEIMHEASAFLKGSELDSIMNYPFKHAMTEFFARRIIGESEFMDYLAANRNIYMEKITRQLWNLLDSHDTARFLTEARGETVRLKLAMAFQFTYVGVPYIYYGDEVGIDGGHDPYSRRCMVWDEAAIDSDLLKHTKQLIAFRLKTEAMIYGKFIEHTRGDGCIVFERSYEGEAYLCAFNNTDYQRVVPIPEGEYRDVTPSGLYLGASGPPIGLGEITLAPMSYRILKGEVLL